MPLNSKDLSATEKVKVALDCLHRELLGDSSASKTVAQKYNLSTRGVTVIRNQALDILQKGFSPDVSPSSPTATGIDNQTLDRTLDALVGTPPSEQPTTTTSAPKQEESKTLTIEAVFGAIVEYNKAKKEPPIYVSQGLVQKLSGHSSPQVSDWFANHESEITKHNAKYELTPVTNRRIKRDFDYRAALGLEQLANE